MYYFFSKPLVLVLPLLLSVAFLTLLERKLLSLTGLRVGPNKVSFLGILQPVLDALKLSNKSINLLSNFSSIFYFSSCILMMFSSLVLFSTIFLDPMLTSFKFSILMIFLLLGLNSLNSILSGWSTFSKFSLLGSLRTVSQLISYEASLYLCVFFLVMLYSSFDLGDLNFLHLAFLFLLIPSLGYLWVPTFLAELNRTPYDFSEGESELVSGFNTEFGSSGFTLIFLAEYGNIVFFSFVTGVFMFSSFIGVFLVLFFVIWIRSVLPRFRFDKLMALAWKFLIPFLTCLFLFFFLLSL